MALEKRILFFLVHPSKYHLFKNAINTLKKDGYQIDITIITKDVLEELIRNEGWEYVNLIPKGRRSRYLPPRIAVIYFALKTLWKLWFFTEKKKYDLFISDDLLSIIGKLRKIKTLHFQDDDLSVVPESRIILFFADKIISPNVCDLGKYNRKKIGYNGTHELAYLHPNWFKPNIDIVKRINPNLDRYFVIRLVSLSATHDFGKSGINNNQLELLINTLENYGKVYITSEKKLHEQFEKYRVNIKPNDILDFLYYADLFIGDSQTMTSEAALLGVPAFRFNDFVGKISYLSELENFGLCYGFRTDQFPELMQKITECLQIKNLKEIWYEKKEYYIKNKIDVTSWIINLIKENL